MKNNLKVLGLLGTSLLMIAGCGTDQVGSETDLVDGEELTLTTGPWESENASTNVIAQVLEDVGYDVDVITLDAAVIWEAIANNDADGQVGAWLPKTSEPYVEEYGDRVNILDKNLEGAALGLVVPTYMENINSIEDLTDEANQEIIGIEAGASVVAGAQKAVDEYENLSDWTVSTSSAGAMAMELSTAYEDQEEIIVTGWSPHWKFQKYDLKYLEDTKGVFGVEEYIATVTRLGLEDDHPIAYQILDNFYWEVEDMEAVMLDVQEGVPVEEAAKSWVKDNQDKVQTWLEGTEELSTAE